MEYIVVILIGALTILGSAFSKVLADEFKAWAPSLVSYILTIAVLGLPVSRRERAEEEWRSHVNELPGDLGKLIVATGCLLAALRLRATSIPARAGLLRLLDIYISLSSIILFAPLLILVAFSNAVSSSGATAFRHRRDRYGGKFFLSTLEAGERLREKAKSAPMVTAVRRFILVSSLDTLPQLYSVLRGRLSLARHPQNNSFSFTSIGLVGLAVFVSIFNVVFLALLLGWL